VREGLKFKEEKVVIVSSLSHYFDLTNAIAVQRQRIAVQIRHVRW
jgi:hypothetical protein